MAASAKSGSSTNIRYAVIDRATAKVVNIVEWDGATPWNPGPLYDVRLATSLDVLDIPSADALSQTSNVSDLDVHKNAQWNGSDDPFVFSRGSAAGTLTAPDIAAAHKFNLNSENVDATSSNGLFNSYHGSNVGGANAKGHRTSLIGVISVNGRTANTGNGWFYTAGATAAYARANDNGASGAGNARGNLFGGNDSASLLGGATYWNSICGREIDIEVRSGASVIYKIGQQIIQLATDTQAASSANYGYSLANQPGGSQPGWDYGFTFGAKNGVWPIKSTGTVIGADVTDQDGPSYAASYGVDLSNVTFAIAAFKSNGFSVAGDGAITAKSFTIGVKPTVTGSRGGNVALTSLLTALAAIGLITDGTTA